jgi:hypothetical protein
MDLLALTALTLYLVGWAWGIHDVYRAIERGHLLTSEEERRMRRIGMPFHIGIWAKAFYRWPYGAYIRAKANGFILKKRILEYWE